MALVKCKECGAEISSEAKTCPKCGMQIIKKPIGCGTVFGVIFLGIIILASFSSIFSSVTSDNNSHVSSIPATQQTQASLTSKPEIQVATISEPIQPGSQWHYHQNDDEMSKGSIYSARVMSSNTVNFSFPYSGTQHAALILRTHTRHGKDVIFKIEKGQILCPSYDGCKVLVRFDDQEAVSFNATGTADNSTEHYL